MIALPAWANLHINLWISAFAPTSIPRVGSSKIKISGLVSSQRETSTFCWLPPDKSLIT